MIPEVKNRDNYTWLHNKNSQVVADFIQQENQSTEQALGRHADLQQQLVEEMLDRLELSRSTAETSFGEYAYYLKELEGQVFPLYCRRKGAQEEVLFDGNDLREIAAIDPSRSGCSPVDQRVLALCPDQRYWVIAFDWTGNERYQLWVKDLQTNTFVAHTEADVAAQIAWIDAHRFVGLQLDYRNRPYQAIQFSLPPEEPGKPMQERKLYEEVDVDWFLSVQRSASGAYVFLTVKRLQDSTEIHVLYTSESAPKFYCFEQRSPGVRYQLTHHGSHFYVITNEHGANKSLHRIGLGKYGVIEAEDLQACDTEVELYRLQAFNDFLVLYTRHGFRTVIEVIDPQTWEKKQVRFPEESYVLSYAENLNYTSSELRFFYSSLTTPYVFYRYEMAQGTLAEEYTLAVKNYEREQYTTRCIPVKMLDGVEVPVTLVYKESLRREGGNPMLLYGYGAYGYHVPVEFTSPKISLLDRGFIYAIAHVRGGGAYGLQWHAAGKHLNKHNSINDFNACAEFLKREKYTSREQLAIMGESAGGLLVTAAINKIPDLCAAVVAINPFVDVYNTLSNPELPGTSEEWIEWGNPEVEEDSAYILSYSPYENIRHLPYPDMLLICSFNDAQVPFWEACKYKLRLAERNTNACELLLHIRTDVGHQNSNDRYAYVEQEARIYAYLIHKLL